MIFIKNLILESHLNIFNQYERYKTEEIEKYRPNKERRLQIMVESKMH